MKELILKPSANLRPEFVSPFTKEKCDRITLDIYNKAGLLLPAGITVEARLRFVSGASTGYHTIHAADLQEAVQKVNEFLSTLCTNQED